VVPCQLQQKVRLHLNEQVRVVATSVIQAAKKSQVGESGFEAIHRYKGKTLTEKVNKS
jgi:hypothetical protein